MSESIIDLGNFFQVNVNEVQQQVAQLPWVYSVSVRKHWPNELKIYVVDQTPIAMWNGDFLLNQFGKAFQAHSTALTHALPEFFGPEHPAPASRKAELRNQASRDGYLHALIINHQNLIFNPFDQAVQKAGSLFCVDSCHGDAKIAVIQSRIDEARERVVQQLS